MKIFGVKKTQLLEARPMMSIQTAFIDNLIHQPTFCDETTGKMPCQSVQNLNV